jgi:hypothetical protein
MASGYVRSTYTTAISIPTPSLQGETVVKIVFYYQRATLVLPGSSDLLYSIMANMLALAGSSWALMLLLAQFAS